MNASTDMNMLGAFIMLACPQPEISNRVHVVNDYLGEQRSIKRPATNQDTSTFNNGTVSDS